MCVCVCVRDAEEIMISRRKQGLRSGIQSGPSQAVPDSCVNPGCPSTMPRVGGHFRNACFISW